MTRTQNNFGNKGWKIAILPPKTKAGDTGQTMSRLFEFLLEKEFKILDHVSYWNGLFIIAALVICIMYSCTLLIIPQHDVIQSPQYWYELIIIFTVVYPVYNVLGSMQDCYISFGTASILTSRTAAHLFLASAMGFNVPYCLCYLIWTIGLGYNPPIPFAVFCCYPMVIVFCVVLWFEFPHSLRTDKKYRKRLQVYLSSFTWSLVVHFQYSGLSTLFTALPFELHWILAIIMPTLRYLNLHVYKKFVDRYAGRDNDMAMIRTSISVGIEYSMFVAIQLASATEITLFLILGGEFVLNIHKCYRILRLRRKIRTNYLEQTSLNKELQNNIRDLVLNETIEILVPLAYFSTFVIAYVGPNSTILGGVKNNYWDYEMVDNLGRILMVGMEMFFLDLSSLVICGGVLIKFCKINLLQEFCKFFKQCWTLITILLSGKLVTVSNHFIIFFQ